MKKKLIYGVFSLMAISLLAGCGAKEEAAAGSKKELTFGATVPYSEMLEKGVVPHLEEKGYSVKVTEFQDYVQPNISLGNGSLDANLFQHKVYLEGFAKENNLDLVDVIPVPTAPIGIYSEKYTSIDEIKDGSTVAIANDPANTARGLTVLRDAGLITFNDAVDPLKASVKDVRENPKNLQFHEVEAAQLPRSLQSVDLAAVNGNFAVSAGLDLTQALYLDKIPDEIQNRVVIRTEDLDEQFVKDIIEAVESEEFLAVIDKDFQGFHKPKWMTEK